MCTEPLFPLTPYRPPATPNQLENGNSTHTPPVEVLSPSRQVFTPVTRPFADPFTDQPVFTTASIVTLVGSK